MIEQSSISLACEGGLNTWLCLTRQVVTALFRNSVFGFFALAAAVLNLLRPSLVLTGIAVALLILSLARRAPAPE